MEGISGIHDSRSQSVEIEFNDEDLGMDVIDAVNKMETLKRDQQAQLRNKQLEDETQMERDTEEERFHQRCGVNQSVTKTLKTVEKSLEAALQG